MEAEQIAKLEARVAELEARNARLEELATKDALTGLSNRRDFDETVEVLFRDQAVENKRIEKKAWTFVVFDIDNFKVINDTYGHETGDRILVEASRYLREVVGIREGRDKLARYGGEEFVMLLKGCGEEDALRKFGKFYNEASGKIELKFQSEIGEVTFSAGLREFVPGDDQTFRDVYHKADEALYHGKRNGKNQITAYRPKIKDAQEK